MAGYSGTPLPQKLGIKPNYRVVLLNAPENFDVTLGVLPANATVQPALLKKQAADVILLFTTARADLAKRFPAAAKRLQPAGGLWVCWPKKASGVATDLTENVVREVGLAAGLVDNKVCAVDDTWSGLRFVFRLKDRPGN